MPLTKASLTGHFRVALKPQDVNIERPTKRMKKLLDVGKENIEVITIKDDDDDDVNNVDGCLIQQDQTTKTTSSIKEEQQEEQQIHSQSPINKYTSPPGIGPNVIDFDKISLKDIYYEPHYAWDSFDYDKQQELKFRTRKYILNNNDMIQDICRQTQLQQVHHNHNSYNNHYQHNHHHNQHQHYHPLQKSTYHHLNNNSNHNQPIYHQFITPRIRAQFVDWLVYAQDNFGLWHETIYMAVKMADQYMMRKTVSNKNDLQLLYLTAILISSKLEERMPSVSISQLTEFAYPIYSVDEVIRFEVELLSTLEFNIRFPLSWGFLRRYAHCTRSDKETLSLSRYILETSLLDYEMIDVLESKIAAASLLLASKMLYHEEPWSETAQFYTGYKQEELHPLLPKLNYLISHPNRRLNAIRTKYSHPVFRSVAKIPPLSSV